MGRSRWRHIVLLLCLALHVLVGSAAPEIDYLPPPTNITFGMDGMFCLVWQWKPPENIENCSLKYTENIVSNNEEMPSPPRKRGLSADFKVHVENFDLNNEIHFEVQGECNNTSIKSEYVSLVAQLAAGNQSTSVRNLICVWYYMENVNCTWQHGQDAPLGVNYTLLYWTTDKTSCQGDGSQPTQFHNLLDTGKHCQNYTIDNGIPVGCQFRLQKSFNEFRRLVIVVTDRTKNVKPFIFYIFVNNIAKLRPPTINKVNRTPNQSIYVSWNASDVHKELLHEVLLEMSNSESNEHFTNILGLSKEIPNALPDVTYTVKVRVRLPDDATDRNNFLWSEWSKETTLPGKDGGRTTSIILLLLIPAIIIVAAVVLLIYMRRLQILVFPRIPDPGRVLSNDLQQWIKSGRMLYNEPKKDEICQVSLLETPLPPSHVE